MIEVLMWIIVTLIIITIVALIAKKQGVEYLIGTFVAMILISNVLANKMVVFAYWVVPAGIIAYSVSFFITDIINEFYDRKKAQKAVWIGFLINIILVILVYIAIQWEPASFWKNQEQFKLILGNTWRIVLGSLVAYLISQNHDIWSFNFWKKKTNGKYLWLRNNISTITSQILDTLVFVFIAFYGLFPLTSLIIGLIIVKIIIALLDTPFIYLVKKIYNKL